MHDDATNQDTTKAGTDRDAHRARYETLRKNAQEARRLPALSARGLVLDPRRVVHQEHVPGGWYFTTRVRRGEALRVVNPSGRSTVSFFAWCEDDVSERISVADTIKVQWTTQLQKGLVIYTDMGRIAFSIIEDSCGAHDPFAGPTTRETMTKAFGESDVRNTRDNFFAAAAKHGLNRRDISACLNLFAPVSIAPGGRFIWDATRSIANDFIDLRAEMDMLVVLSNAGHPLDPNVLPAPEAVTVFRFVSPEPEEDDLCRHAGPEAERAFRLTDDHYCNKQTIRTIAGSKA